jgi:hypothetical protein
MDIKEIIFRNIKADLAMRGMTFARIGTGLEPSRSRQQVWQVAKGLIDTAYIRRAIAEAIGRDPWAENGH